MANNISECDIFSNSTDLPSHLKDLEDALQFKFFLKEWLPKTACRARRNALPIKCWIA